MQPARGPQGIALLSITSLIMLDVCSTALSLRIYIRDGDVESNPTGSSHMYLDNYRPCKG